MTDELPSLASGAVAVDPFTSEVWYGTGELNFCRDCYYNDTCRAGCSWTTHVLFGKPGNNPYCHHRALEHQARGLRERLVPVASAPGRPFDHGLFEVVVEAIPGAAPARRLPVVER